MSHVTLATISRSVAAAAPKRYAVSELVNGTYVTVPVETTSGPVTVFAASHYAAVRADVDRANARAGATRYVIAPVN